MILIAKIAVKSEYKQLVKLFDNLTGSKSLWQVFNDCIECYAIAIQNAFAFGKRHNELEERYKNIMNGYKLQDRQTIVTIFVEIQKMLEENPWRDLLGDLFMQLDMGSDTLGQFFTPYCVAQMMAATSKSIEEVKAEIQEKGYITVNEPTCGGGCNVIAFCEYLHINDINYQKDCVVVCQDLSRIAALMCYIVLSLIGCSAVIKVGDTLANPFTNYRAEVSDGSELWTTPFFHLNNCYNKI